MHPTWFPPEALLHTGRLRSAGSESPTSSPASQLLCSPPTSPPPSAAASVPLASGLPRCRSLFCAAPRMPLRTRSASETGHRLSATPGSFEERRGPPRFLGRPLRARRGRTPRRIRPFLAPTPLRGDPRKGRRRLQVIQNPGHPEWHSFRGRIPHGSHARVPTLRRPRCRGRRKARYRLGRAHPWPGGFRTRWTTNEVSWSHRTLHSPSTRRAWSH